MPLSQIFNVANVSFNAIRENKILTKIINYSMHIYSPLNLVSSPWFIFMQGA